MRKTFIRSGAAALAAVALVLAATDAAVAAPVSTTASKVSSSAMYIDHFDAEVAAQHGYEIVVDANGVERSIPVTAEARAEAQKFTRLNDAQDVTANGSATVVGPCGSSSLKLERTGLNVRATTSYNVYAPVSIRVWNVTYGLPGVATIPFSGGPSGRSWASFGVIPYPAGGWGHVTPGSFVVLTNGAFCYSGAPGAGF